MSSRNMSLLPRATLHSDSEQIYYLVQLIIAVKGDVEVA
jgi:hypothetical protein